MPRRQSRLAPHPQLVRREVQIGGLDPRHDGVTIAHLTDVHVGRLTPRSHVQHAVELANGAGADVIALTGDYVCWQRREIDVLREQLAGLSATKVVATLGNHDYFTSAHGVAEALRGCGYEVLRNQSVTVDLRGAPLHIIGVDDPVTRKDDSKQAFAELPRSGTRVALVHCPESADELAELGADVILSGHTHGGQIWLRGLSDRIFYRGMKRRYRVGIYRVGRAHLHVGAGVGFSGLRARVGNGTRSEVAVLTLRRAAVSEFAA